MRRLNLLFAVAAGLWCAPGALASGWCGTGELSTDRPDAVTGRQVHAIYAVPSDGTDTVATGAPRMADDIASIDSWWQGQDATRVPRFDQAVFPTGTCVDISFVRLVDPASAFVGNANAAFTRISADLGTAGFDNPFKKYSVYFDGPSVQQDVCGTGGGAFDSGPSYAVVWLQGCPDVPSDSIGAHELLHALGALPLGAPHACTPATDPFGVADTGHPCDSTQDVLYPVNSGAPLTQLVLDVGHDDYYAHSGSWNDIQDSLWLLGLNVPQVQLTVSMAGAGSIQSDLPGLDCSTPCATAWQQGTTVSLIATPTPKTRFIRWQGACTGNADCTLTLDSAQAAQAVFGPTRIPVRVRTTGKGHVLCVPRCSSSFVAGTGLTLHAIAAKGWRFAGWSGGCKGKRLACLPATDFALTVHATFKKQPAPKPRTKARTKR